MNQITFLHCAGLNLGYGFKVSGYSDAKKLTIRREDLKKVFAKILEIASYEKADFILISGKFIDTNNCLLYTSPSPRDRQKSRMPSSA